MSRAIYDLHMEAFWICVVIAVVVFGAMIYSMVKFRHSQGAIPDTTMLHSTKVEIIWTIIPVRHPGGDGGPGGGAHPQNRRHAQFRPLDPRHRLSMEMAVPIHGCGRGHQFLFDAASRIRISRANCTPASTRRRVPNYLLDVDHPLVVPSGVKVRLLLTSARRDPCLVRPRFRHQALGDPGLRQ